MGTTGPYHLTFNAPTRLWSRTSEGIISYDYDLTLDPYGPAGPFLVNPVTVPDDPVHKTGGAFWELKEGPKSGWLVSSWSNQLDYGDITVTGTASPPEQSPGAWGNPTINPDHPWRLLIKGLKGSDGAAGPHYLTFNAPTQLWSRTNSGIISYDYDIAHGPDGTGGPYRVNPITVPFDPVHQTGGSFWELKEGPNAGWLVSAWSNELDYGDISVTNTENFSRGPGDVIATFYHPAAHLCGASLNYNATGEMHFTLLVDDPNVPLIAPKQCHYAIEFLNLATMEWEETFQGVVWDLDASDTEVVYTGIDYLGLLTTIVDERYDPNNFNRPVPQGSKYVNMMISDIIRAHLSYSIGLANSWVNFLQIGSIDELPEQVTLWSASQDTLSFILGLINSHRAGTGKNTRLYVTKGDDGVYRFNLDEDPGVNLDNLPVSYGQLAQGYHAIKFGKDWASRANLIGRAMDPTSTIIRYASDDSGVDQSVWGRIGGAFSVVYTADNNDLKRRVRQKALDDARLGKQLSIGLKLGSFCPLEGYNLCDCLPIAIDHGAVRTADWSSDVFGQDDPADPSTVTTNYWSIFQLQWESYDDGHWMTSFGLWPVGGGRPLPPDAAEPDYNVPENSWGGDGWVFLEVTGVKPAAKYLDSKVQAAGGASLQLPTAVGLDASLRHFAFAGVDASGDTTIGPIDGWVADLPQTAAGNGGSYMMALHKIMDAGPTTLTPGPLVFVPPSAHEMAVIAVWEATGPAVIPHVRQVYPFNFGITGYNSYANKIHLPLDPLPGSLLIALGVGGYYFRSNDPGDPNNFTDSGLGCLVDDSPYGYPHGMRLAFRTAHPGSASTPDPIVPKDEIKYGDGAPPDPATSTPTSSIYIDNASGIQYRLSDDGTTWVPIPGTGYLASGKYDFTFTAATEWVIDHILDGYPEVMLLDSDGNEIEAAIVYNSVSRVTVTFSEPVAGSAHLR